MHVVIKCLAEVILFDVLCCHWCNGHVLGLLPLRFLVGLGLGSLFFHLFQLTICARAFAHPAGFAEEMSKGLKELQWESLPFVVPDYVLHFGVARVAPFVVNNLHGFGSDR